MVDKTLLTVEGQPLPATIYVPDGVDQRIWLPRLQEAVERRGYDLHAVSRDGQTTWAETVQQAVGCASCGREPTVGVIMVPRYRLLDPCRLPRVEEAD
jgi:hypothetical protein